jgi:hypothetical protein
MMQGSDRGIGYFNVKKRGEHSNAIIVLIVMGEDEKVWFFS